MPSAHGPIFCRRPKSAQKSGLCALTFGPIKIGPIFSRSSLLQKISSRVPTSVQQKPE